MVIAVALICLAAGVAIGFLAGKGRSANADPASFEGTRADLVAVRAELDTTRSDLEAARIEAATLRTELSAKASLEQTEEAMANLFAKISSDALGQANDNLIKLAEQRFSADDKDRKAAFHAEFEPINQMLVKYEAALARLNEDQAKQFSTVMGQVEVLKSSSAKIQEETSTLSKALREPTTKGQWGELQLRRVVEFAGMVEHCDFNEQVHSTHEDGAGRPDLVVHLPGGLNIIVDSKFPFTAYGKIAEAVDEAGRKSATAEHGKQVKAHVDALAKRRYQDKVDQAAPFVVIFLPADPILSAALDAEPGLYDYALSKGVLPASPTTLIALLHSAAYSWRNDKLAEEAQEVRRLGAELYSRLATVGEHLTKLGRNLNGSVKSFNEVIGSMEQRVNVSVRKFQALGVVGEGKEIAAVDQIETSAREVNVADQPTNVAELRKAEGDV